MPNPIGSYKDIKEGCNGDAHHVRPDLMSRFPGVKGNPVSHEDAIAICIHPVAHKKTHSQMYVGWGGIRKDGKASTSEAVTEANDALAMR